jgi:glutamate racemase
VAEGDIVAQSLVNYLQRHPEMESKLTQNSTQQFFTTNDETVDFDHYAEMFFNGPVKSKYAELKC